MSAFNKRLKSVFSCIHKITDKGALERDQKMALLKALKDLEHYLGIKNVEGLKKAIERIARIFIGTMG